KKGRAAAEGEEQQEDNSRRVHVEGILARGGDVDHGVQGGEKKLRRVDARAWSRRSGDGLLPDLVLQTLRDRRDFFGDGVVEAEARGGVVAEELAEGRLSGRRQQIETEVGGADVVRLFDQELTM